MTNKKRKWLLLGLKAGLIGGGLLFVFFVIPDAFGFVFGLTIALTAAWGISEAVVVFCRKRNKKITRSTGYTISAVAMGLIGFFSIEVGILTGIHGFPSLLFYGLAGVIGFLAFVNILTTGEIIKLSGVAKLVILLVIGLAIARLTVVHLNQFRLKQHHDIPHETQSESELENDNNREK